MTDEELIKIFSPEIPRRLARLAAGGRLVHYTSAEAGYRIISGKEVWLRNALLMNDFSEMQHGLSCLQNAWISPAGLALQEWLEEILPGFRDQVVTTFDQHADGFKVATFVMSLSQHENDEDEYGKLSMWRAYGGNSGVALVLNPSIFASSTDEMKVFSAPVAYRSIPEFVLWFAGWVEGLARERERLATVQQDRLLAYFFATFRMFVLCTKHPGFHEEREWRIFHSPLLDGTSKWLRKENEVIRGIPQEVVKITLKDDEDSGVVGVDPVKLINRVIIGPSQHPVPIYHALHNALAQAGIEDPSKILWMSEIPLRQ